MSDPTTRGSAATIAGEYIVMRESLRRAVVEALGLPYGTPEMFGHTRYPTDAEIVSWVTTEHERVRKMHDGHHVGVEGFCPDCGMYGKGATNA